MTALRLFFAFLCLALLGYTLVVGSNHGWSFMPTFFGDIRAMTWPGQFNADFMCYLAMSALWVSWRHEFSPAGLALGVCAFFGGALFLSAYLVVMSFKVDGNINALLLGSGRAQA